MAGCLRSLSRFQRGWPLRPWLLAILANRCRMAIRKRPPLHLSLDAESEPDAAADPIAPVGESPDYLVQLLSDLPLEQQRALELRYFADLELSEIAHVTGWPVGTVKSRLHRALASLREQIQHRNVVTQED